MYEPFPSCLFPLFQNKSRCATFHDHMYGNEFDFQDNEGASITHFHMKG